MPNAVVYDERSLFARMIRNLPESYSGILGDIDPYGITVMNCLQIPRIVEELDRLGASRGSSAEQLHQLGRIRELAELALKEQRLLTFAGD